MTNDIFASRVGHDYLSSLCKSNPQGFETMTRGEIKKAINTASSEETRHKLIIMQYNIDAALSVYGKNDVARMNAMVTIFWKSLNGEGLIEFGHYDIIDIDCEHVENVILLSDHRKK